MQSVRFRGCPRVSVDRHAARVHRHRILELGRRMNRQGRLLGRKGSTVPVEPVLASLQARSVLRDRFGDSALLLYALEMRFGIDDVMTVGATAITDGPRDRKCDAVYIDRDTATAVIAQAYFSLTHRTEAPSNKAADLNTAVTWVFGGSAGQMPESLAAAAAELRQAVTDGEVETIELWYCHNLAESKNVGDELDRAAGTAKALLQRHFPDSLVEVRALEVGITRLGEWYQSVQSPILVADDIEIAIDGWFEETGADWTAICASVPATWLTALHQTYGDRLFSANVRGYMPSRRTARNINHNMETTAKEQPGQFWAFNNGITGLVHDYDAPPRHLPGEKLVLHGLAIINGAQTTGALSRASGPTLRDAAVLARFIRCDDDAIVDDLIRFNNSQNPIRASDFRSTDRHQDRLRREFAVVPNATYLGARRGGQQDRARRPSNLVPSDTAAQCLAAFHGDPAVAYHDLRGIWDRDEVYSKYFSDFTTAAHIVFVYSLLTSIQAAKASLVNRESAGGSAALASDEAEILSFFRQRGSQFLLMAAVSSSIEIFLGVPVANRFALSFGVRTSPAIGANYWHPTVEVILPFTHCLRADELKGSLRNRNRVEDAIAQFRASVRSTARSNEEVFQQFRSRVNILAGPAGLK
jgi:hypothetical protein